MVATLPDKKSGTGREAEYENILHDVSQAWNLTEFQRDKSNESIRFIDVPGGQWEGWVNSQFANRPRLEMDRVSQSVNLFNGEWRASRFTVKYRPDDGETSDEDADLMNGLFRKDWRRSNGDQSMDNAVAEMSKGGVGAIKLKTEFVVSDDPDDKRQKIVFEEINNAYNTVVWDPNAKCMDKSDAAWCSVLTTYTDDAFRAAFPEIPDPSSFFKPWDRNIFNYNNVKLYYVAEHYQVRHKMGLAFSYRHEVTGEKKVVFKEDLRDILESITDAGFVKVGERRIKQKFIEKSILYGGGFIERPRKIIGTRIPIAPCYGYRSYVDGQEYFYGIVEKQKDTQRLVNMAISTMAENAATSPKSTPLFTPEQVAGHENRLAELHLGKYTYATINGKDSKGRDLPLGPVGEMKPAQVDPNTVTVLELGSEYMRAQSGGAPQDVIDPDASGKAINAAIGRVDMMSQVLMDNIAQCVKNVGQIYLGMASQVYDEERFVKLLNEDDTEREVLLMQYVPHPKLNKFVRINDVTEMQLEVIVDTGPTFATRRRETVDVLSQLIQTTPEGSPYISLLYAGLVENIEGPGLQDVKKFNKMQMLVQGLREPENEEEALLLAQIREQQNAPDPTAALIAAEAERARGEGVRNQSQAIENFASAELKNAQALETRVKAASEVQKTQRDNRDSEVDNFKTLSELSTRTSELITQI